MHSRYFHHLWLPVFSIIWFVISPKRIVILRSLEIQFKLLKEYEVLHVLLIGFIETFWWFLEYSRFNIMINRNERESENVDFDDSRFYKCMAIAYNLQAFRCYLPNFDAWKIQPDWFNFHLMPPRRLSCFVLYLFYRSLESGDNETSKIAKWSNRMLNNPNFHLEYILLICFLAIILYYHSWCNRLN